VDRRSSSPRRTDRCAVLADSALVFWLSVDQSAEPGKKPTCLIFIGSLPVRPVAEEGVLWRSFMIEEAVSTAAIDS
jgi:hypothetical protein